MKMEGYGHIEKDIANQRKCEEIIEQQEEMKWEIRKNRDVTRG